MQSGWLIDAPGANLNRELREGRYWGHQHLHFDYTEDIQLRQNAWQDLQGRPVGVSAMVLGATTTLNLYDRDGQPELLVPASVAFGPDRYDTGLVVRYPTTTILSKMSRVHPRTESLPNMRNLHALDCPKGGYIRISLQTTNFEIVAAKMDQEQQWCNPGRRNTWFNEVQGSIDDQAGVGPEILSDLYVEETTFQNHDYHPGQSMVGFTPQNDPLDDPDRILQFPHFAYVEGPAYRNEHNISIDIWPFRVIPDYRPPGTNLRKRHQAYNDAQWLRRGSNTQIFGRDEFNDITGGGTQTGRTSIDFIAFVDCYQQPIRRTPPWNAGWPRLANNATRLASGYLPEDNLGGSIGARSFPDR